MSDWMRGDIDRFDSSEHDEPDDDAYERGPIVEEIERNGSLSFVRFKDGSEDWVDSRDVDGWLC